MISVVALSPVGAGATPILRLAERSGAYRLLFLSFNLACDGTAANRYPVISLEANKGVRSFMIGDTGAKVVASTNGDFSFFTGSNPASGLAGIVPFGVHLPDDGFFVPAGYNFRLDVVNVQAGDVLSNAFCLIEDVE